MIYYNIYILWCITFILTLCLTGVCDVVRVCTVLTLVCALIKKRANATWRAMLLQRRAQATVAPLPYMGVLLASAGLVRTKTAPRGFEFMLTSFVCCRYEDGHFCCGDMLHDNTWLSGLCSSGAIAEIHTIRGVLHPGTSSVYLLLIGMYI